MTVSCIWISLACGVRHAVIAILLFVVINAYVLKERPFTLYWPHPVAEQALMRTVIQIETVTIN